LSVPEYLLAAKASTFVRTQRESQMRKVSLFGIAITIILAGIAVWVSSSHSAIKADVEAPQIDPFSLMANAKNLPTQEELNSKLWPDNGVVHY
jgi:hypothetical protein